jgi:hypothetical protein
MRCGGSSASKSRLGQRPTGSANMLGAAEEDLTTKRTKKTKVKYKENEASSGLSSLTVICFFLFSFLSCVSWLISPHSSFEVAQQKSRGDEPRGSL